MQRSIGVTLTAVLVFLGCAVALLLAAFAVITSQMSPSPILSTPIMRAMLLLELVFVLAFMAWGIASAIGLLQLRGWARMSMIVFSGIMICFCAIPMLLFAFIPLPQPQGVSANFDLMIRVFMELFYGFFVGLGIFWIYFFNRKNVKAQFAPGAPSQTAIALEPCKPVPIIVLGVLFLLSACFMAFPIGMHTPLYFFGSFPGGPAKLVLILVLLAANSIAGIGLLRLKLWGWWLAQIVSIFAVLNTACLFVVPGAMDRLNAAIAQREAAMGVPEMPPQFISLRAAMLISLGFGFAVYIAYLWILIAYRKAFPRHPERAAAI